MFLMLATMLAEIGEAFAEDAAEELGGTFEDELSEAIEEISEEFDLGGSEDTGDGEMPVLLRQRRRYRGLRLPKDWGRRGRLWRLVRRDAQ